MQIDFRGACVYYEIQTDEFCARHPANDVPIVLLHGWGGSSATMKCIAGGLSGYKVISFDFPPFGHSSPPPDIWSLADYTDSVIEVLSQHGISKAVFVGHSFGGRVCIDIASRTTLASKVVLVDAAGIRPKNSLKKFFARLRFKRDKRKGRDVRRYYSSDYLALDPNMQKVFSRILNEDLSGRLAKITCPTLIIWGREDRDTPLYMARKMHRRIRGSGLIILDGGHFSYLDNFGDFMIILNTFIGN